jgi:hypothetical protein
VILLAPCALAERDFSSDSGLRVTLHTADDVRERWLVEEDGRAWLRHPIAGSVELDRRRHRWTDLEPVAPETVEAALRSMHGFRTDVAVQIFLLPGFPADVLASFARREAVFLAPGLAPQAPETVAYTATHELGHVFCWAALDGRPARWNAYRRLRGLGRQQEPESVPHAQRHREILAEDFRFLFGGPQATRSGTIENPDLPLPGAVAGLEELLAGYLAEPNGGRHRSPASRVYPNPCRDLAVVELDLPEGVDLAKGPGETTLLEIHDLRGRLVSRSTLGRVAGGRVSVTWDGRTADGRIAPAGLYLYRIRHGDAVASGRLLRVAP